MRKVLVISLAAALLATVLVAAGCGCARRRPRGRLHGGGRHDRRPDPRQVAAGDGEGHERELRRRRDVQGRARAARAPRPLLLGQTPIVAARRRQGRRQERPATAAAVAMTLQAAGQNLALGLKAVQQEGLAPASRASGMSRPRARRRSATERRPPAPSPIGRASLGIDPQKWAKSSTVTTEQLNGATVYHVVTTADTAKIMDDLVKALNTPALSEGGRQRRRRAEPAQELGPSSRPSRSRLPRRRCEFWVDAEHVRRASRARSTRSCDSAAAPRRRA